MRRSALALFLAISLLPQAATATSSTFLGGAGDDSIQDSVLVVDQLFVTGATTSTEFGGAGTETNRQVFVARIPTDLSAIQVTTFGGDGHDIGKKIAIHPSSGHLIVFGETNDATNFSGDQLGPGGYEDIFVAALDTNLNLVSVSLVGGDGLDYATDMDINADDTHAHYGSVYISGKTNSDNLPSITNAPQATRAGILDAYVMQLSGDLSTVAQSTFLGGSHGSESYVTVSVAPSGKVYLFGVTNSDDFPCTDGTSGTGLALQGVEGGETDLFLALLDAQLKSFQTVTYLGGDGSEEGSTNIGLKFDATTDDVYIIAEARSTNFPTPGSPDRLRGFVARINANLTSIITASNIEGSSEVLDAAFHPTTGELYIVGSAASTLAGTTGGAQETSGGGTGECFMARYSHDLATLGQATFLGGNDHEFPAALAFNADASEVYAVGYTESRNFPGVTSGAQELFDGGREGFVARFNAELTSMLQATFLGGAQDDGVYEVFVIGDDDEEVLVVGGTGSADFPFAEDTAQTTYGGGSADGFVTLLQPTLSDAAVADLALLKSAPEGVAVGAGLTYTLEVTNQGPGTASDVTVIDIMPDGLVVDSVTPAAACTVSPAGIVVDQEHDPGTPNSYGSISDVSHRAQTFAVGLSGQLTGVDVFVYRLSEDASASLLLDIRGTDANGAPLEDDSTALAQVSLAASDVPTTRGFVSIDLSTNPVEVTAGDQLAIVVRAQGDDSTSNPYTWGGTSRDNPYPAGKYYVRNETLTTWTAMEDVGALVPDLGFRTEITVAYASVSCDLNELAAEENSTVIITTTAPNRDTYIENTATVYTTSNDPNLDNNHSSTNTVVGDPQSDDPPVNPPSQNDGGVPDRCDCGQNRPSLVWFTFAVLIAWLRRRR